MSPSSLRIGLYSTFSLLCITLWQLALDWCFKLFKLFESISRLCPASTGQKQQTRHRAATTRAYRARKPYIFLSGASIDTSHKLMPCIHRTRSEHKMSCIRAILFPLFCSVLFCALQNFVIITTNNNIFRVGWGDGRYVARLLEALDPSKSS
ncbi:hypothetical protein BKA64DRAFT_341367 [Cadophora sp. MPI-SDFR-AT-0126]|nr:hypothetical protein BKA64DRAFT_341367 [Leotiomycetes sp. MPI-SDFR-AT-0126]